MHHIFQKDDKEKEKLNTLVVEKEQGGAPDFQKDSPEKEDSLQKAMLELPAVENLEGPNDKTNESKEMGSRNRGVVNENLKETHGEEEPEPVFDGTEVPGMEVNRSTSTGSLDLDSETQGSWPEKAMALKNFVREKSAVAVSSVLRRLSGKSDYGGQDIPDDKASKKTKQNSRRRYVEINIDVYPSRKLELEKIAGSSAVPRVFFNEILIGGLNELKGLDDSGKLSEKIEYVIAEVPPFEAPLPPLSGEDDMSASGAIDELAIVARKMKESIPVKDRFYKMRRFTNCVLGSEAVDFLSEDKYLERKEAVEFGRKLASKFFFQHVLDEHVFEDGNHLYRFLDHDPVVMSQCYNIPRAYTSEDGKHVDYRSIHGSEEFARLWDSIHAPQYHVLEAHSTLASGDATLYGVVALPYSEPLIHFALAWGHRSGPALRCFSPGNIDKELMEAAQSFLRSGGLIVDLNAKIASVSRILRWYSIDFGKNEVEVLKHAANYLEMDESEGLLELLATTQLKVVYQPYDWGLNY
ncbi:electron carrier/ protein disulfide oxidoreductase [Actinidia rufa]|uniref:Electron carrier/ protein disulfide oxidoreductase n=1 Tax=Actinidia rufa TaxID=165716 RepID=A0A7J0FD17_9ERIC|nr:electron carrier/ protein disulfide oxidoreductase [Actinidia rufa]